MITIMARPSPEHRELLEQIEEWSGQQIAGCYQCGTCSSSCPFIGAMDIHPHMVIRALMVGLREQVLQSRTIWICVSCLLCAERCPRGIDMARVMEALRQTSLRRGIDHLSPSQLMAQDLEHLPQIALVAHLRKHTG